MSNLVNPYRFAAAGGRAPPAGAIAYADFLDPFYYAGGVETTAAAMFDLYKPARHEAEGYKVDFNLGDNEGLNAQGAFLADLNSAADDGLTLVLDIQTDFNPTVPLAVFFTGVDISSATYIFELDANSGSGKEARMVDGGNFDFLSNTNDINGDQVDPNPDFNKFAACFFRDEGGGNFGCAVSVNGNAAVSDVNVGVDGSTVQIDGCEIGGQVQYFLALGPDGYIREIILYGPKSDAELVALST